MDRDRSAISGFARIYPMGRVTEVGYHRMADVQLQGLPTITTAAKTRRRRTGGAPLGPDSRPGMNSRTVCPGGFFHINDRTAESAHYDDSTTISAEMATGLEERTSRRKIGPSLTPGKRGRAPGEGASDRSPTRVPLSGAWRRRRTGQ